MASSVVASRWSSAKPSASSTTCAGPFEQPTASTIVITARKSFFISFSIPFVGRANRDRDDKKTTLTGQPEKLEKWARAISSRFTRVAHGHEAMRHRDRGWRITGPYSQVPTPLQLQLLPANE